MLICGPKGGAFLTTVEEKHPVPGNINVKNRNEKLWGIEPAPSRLPVERAEIKYESRCPCGFRVLKIVFFYLMKPTGTFVPKDHACKILVKIQLAD